MRVRHVGSPQMHADSAPRGAIAENWRGTDGVGGGQAE